MLESAIVSVALPAQDLERAKSFYADKFGLKPTRESEEDASYELGGGSSFGLFRSSGTPSGDHTQADFSVQNFDEVIEGLRSNGVVFEEYDLPGFKTENGILTLEGIRGVWIKDSEGNLIAITEPLTS